MYTAQYYIVEVAAALIGLSYPFIYQIISALDTKYESVHIVRLFRSNWINRAYNVALIVLMICVILMPFIYEKETKDDNLSLFSFESFSLVILFLTLVLMICLFRHINRFYDLNRLHAYIENGIKRDIKSIRKRIAKSQKENILFQQRISNALSLEYWVSHYLISKWNREIEKNQEKIRGLKNIDILSGEKYYSLIDLIRLAIREGDTRLYKSTSDTLHYCIKEARNRFEDEE